MTGFIPAPALSPRQKQLIETIERMTADRGFPPTLVECAAAMGLHPSRIHQLASTTERKGWLCREPKIARSWRVVRPDTSKATSKRGR
jgi:SOS-response transcriptional repressor LexA